MKHFTYNKNALQPPAFNGVPIRCLLLPSTGLSECPPIWSSNNPAGTASQDKGQKLHLRARKDLRMCLVQIPWRLTASPEKVHWTSSRAIVLLRCSPTTHTGHLSSPSQIRCSSVGVGIILHTC